MTQPARTKTHIALYPLITRQERLSAWEKARGMWKGKRPDPIRVLKRIRQEWERKLPH